MPTNPLIPFEEIKNQAAILRHVPPLSKLVKQFLRIDQINDSHCDFMEQYKNGTLGDSNFFVAALRHLRIRYTVTQEDIDRIPKTGPLFVVANHPFGCADGLILGALLTQARPDVRLLANELLNKIEPMQPWVFGVDVFGGDGSRKHNTNAIKNTMRWLNSDGCVATFPSGTVSHFSWKTLSVYDPAWNDHVTNIAKKTGASVLPVYFEGRNSNMFQLSGLIHPLFRTAFIGRELERVIGRDFKLRVGKAIRPKKLDGFDQLADATRFLRLSTYILKEREIPDVKEVKIRRFPLSLKKKKLAHEKIVDPVDKAQLIEEIESLPSESLLFEHGTYHVYVCKASEIPYGLVEIGRLREITFREIGEGTGKSIDLDAFDPHYLHLFLWNNETCEIVGSYRMGLMDEILQHQGKRGLYITTLFKLKDEFLEALNPALELGRSFIRIEYQRKHATLSLLWKGIGTFVGRHPQYSRLIGGVSITADYSRISKDLMVQFLSENKTHPSFSKLVKPRHPHRFQILKKLLDESMKDSAKTMDDVSALISEVEADHKGIPVLLKHYLKLNGVILNFNRDPEFSDVIDGLILVDLEQTDANVLKKHMGGEAWQNFDAHHKNKRI